MLASPIITFVLISFPNFLWAKSKARSGQVRIRLSFDWLFNPTLRDVC